ncbi:MAG: DMT family transporter, partial [Pseudomonadota bacterium]
GLLFALASLSYLWGLTYLPLADSAAIFFVEPLLLTLLATVALGEPIGWRRVLAVIVGFAGALIVIRPSFEAVGPAALLPLLAAFCFAVYLTITRKLATVEDARAMQFWVCVFAALTLMIAMTVGSAASVPVLTPSWPSAGQWVWLVGLGVIATLSHMLAIRAFRLAPASILAPFQYLEILGATILGIIVFSDVPDRTTVLGIAVIVGSGLYVFRREQAAARARSG